MNIKKLNEEIKKVLHEGEEYTFADWFGEDLTGQTYKGDILCTNNDITSLKGSPRVVDGNFIIRFAKKLKSLEGGPQIVTSTYEVSESGIISLKGCPEEVRMFDVTANRLLHSLENGPKEVQSYYCDGSAITSLSGVPNKINGTFSCRWCTDLTTLQGGPEYVENHFDCYGCSKLISLKGAPKYVGWFTCGSNFIEEAKQLGLIKEEKKREVNEPEIITYDTFFTNDENSDEYYEGTLEITKDEDGTYSYYETSTDSSDSGFKTEEEAIDFFREFAEGSWEIVRIG